MCPDVTQSLRLAGPTSGERVAVSGHISTSKPAPATFDAPVYVVLPHSPDLSVPCAWGAIHGATLPAPGAAVLILHDDNGTPVVVWWAGTYTPPT